MTRAAINSPTVNWSKRHKNYNRKVYSITNPKSLRTIPVPHFEDNIYNVRSSGLMYCENAPILFQLHKHLTKCRYSQSRPVE